MRLYPKLKKQGLGPITEILLDLFPWIDTRDPEEVRVGVSGASIPGAKITIHPIPSIIIDIKAFSNTSGNPCLNLCLATCSYHWDCNFLPGNQIDAVGAASALYEVLSKREEAKEPVFETFLPDFILTPFPHSRRRKKMGFWQYFQADNLSWRTHLISSGIARGESLSLKDIVTEHLNNPPSF